MEIFLKNNLEKNAGLSGGTKTNKRVHSKLLHTISLPVAYFGQPQTSIPNFSTQVEMFVAEEFMVEKFMVEKVMVEMSRVEKSGLKLGVKKSRVEISCNPPEEPFGQRQ